jgi:hypothetical protein
LYAEAANSGDSCHALREANKAAIHCAAETPAGILRAPRIVLSLGTISNSDDTYEHSQHEQHEPHGRILVVPL